MMKHNFVKLVLMFCMILFISACAADTSGQSQVSTIEVVKTKQPDIQIQTATLATTNTPNPNLIFSNSPDNKYSIELALAKTPIKLTITNNTSGQKTEIPISNKNYNKIEDDGPQGFRWSIDNKVLMFVLRREPYPEKPVEDFSCFFAIDIEQAKLLTTHFSSIDSHVWIPDKSGVVTIEYGGLNDIFDYYFPATNCYKSTLNSACEKPNVAIDGMPTQ